MARVKGDLTKRFVVGPGTKLKLAKRDPGDTAGVHSRSKYEPILPKNIQRLFNMQRLLAASDNYAVLVVLQAMERAERMARYGPHDRPESTGMPGDRV